MWWLKALARGSATVVSLSPGLEAACNERIAGGEAGRAARAFRSGRALGVRLSMRVLGQLTRQEMAAATAPG